MFLVFINITQKCDMIYPFELYIGLNNARFLLCQIKVLYPYIFDLPEKCCGFWVSCIKQYGGVITSRLDVWLASPLWSCLGFTLFVAFILLIHASVLIK